MQRVVKYLLLSNWKDYSRCPAGACPISEWDMMIIYLYAKFWIGNAQFAGISRPLEEPADKQQSNEDSCIIFVRIWTRSLLSLVLRMDSISVSIAMTVSLFTFTFTLSVWHCEHRHHGFMLSQQWKLQLDHNLLLLHLRLLHLQLRLRHHFHWRFWQLLILLQLQQSCINAELKISCSRRVK